MTPRLQYLLRIEHAPPSERDRIDSVGAAARLPGRRRRRWAQHALVTA